MLNFTILDWLLPFYQFFIIFELSVKNDEKLIVYFGLKCFCRKNEDNMYLFAFVWVWTHWKDF